MVQTTKNTVWPESCRPVTSPLPKCLRTPWAWLYPYMPQQMLVIQLQTRTHTCYLCHFDQNVVNWTFRFSWIGRSLRNWAFWFPSVTLLKIHFNELLSLLTQIWVLIWVLKSRNFAHATLFFLYVVLFVKSRISIVLNRLRFFSYFPNMFTPCTM